MRTGDAMLAGGATGKASKVKGVLAVALALALPVALPSAAGAATPTGPADVILTNARVYTVEKRQPWAEAVAIKDGRILAVGSSAEIARRKGDRTRIVDLGGRLLMPSFGDSHVHPLFGGLSHSRCPIHSGKSAKQYQAIIADCVSKTPGTALLYGVGWGETAFPGNAPRKETLDEISRDRALVFESGDGHSLWVNSKALAMAGITKDTPDPAGGKIGRDPKTGEPTGALYEESAKELVQKFVPPPGPADIQNSILYTMKHFNSLGITNWRDAGVDFAEDGSSAMVEAYRVVRDRGQLDMHVVIDLKWQNERALDQIPALLRAAERAKSYGLRADSVKYYLDGVIPQKTAAMIEPYEGSPERGKSTIPAATLNDAVATLEAKGFQAHVHAIGDRAVREGLDAFAAARKRNGRKDLRHLISHLNVIDPADQPRFGQLGAYAAFQPTWASNYEYMDLSKAAIGRKRSGYIYPAGSVVKGGGKLAYGADWPVATANPLEGLEVAVTRTSTTDPKSDPLLPAEGVTLDQAVAAHTINVAEVNHNEKETGSIAPGKSADMIVLDRNIFDIPITDVSEAKVLLTLVAGKPVFGRVGPLSAPGPK